MADKDLKNAGVEIGHAFKQFGKTFLRSAKTTANNVEDFIDDKPKQENAEPTVYSDGSWRETGKGLGNAFKDFGKALVKEVKDDVNTENKN